MTRLPWVYPTIVGISNWYPCTAKTSSVILRRSAAEAPALSKVEGKNLAVYLEERDSSHPAGAQNDKMLAVSHCQPMHSHVTCDVLTLAICQVQGSATRGRSPETSVLQIWDAPLTISPVGGLYVLCALFSRKCPRLPT